MDPTDTDHETSLVDLISMENEETIEFESDRLKLRARTVEF